MPPVLELHVLQEWKMVQNSQIRAPLAKKFGQQNPEFVLSVEMIKFCMEAWSIHYGDKNFTTIDQMAEKCCFEKWPPPKIGHHTLLIFWATGTHNQVCLLSTTPN
jgi:hypothetical protein